MRISLREFKERVAERYDPDYLVDLLDISSEELLEAFEDKLAEARGNGEFSEVEGEEDDE